MEKIKKYLRRFLAYKIFRNIILFIIYLPHKPPSLIVSTREIIKEHHLEKRLNIRTGESYIYQDNTSLHKDGHTYQSTPYHVLEALVNYLKPESQDIFIDLGSGKGRAVFFMAMQDMRKATGVELNKGLLEISRENLKNFRFNKAPMEFAHTDAAGYKFKDENIFFMFNPFGRQTLQTVVDNIKNSLAENPRRIRLAYYSPAHRDVLDAQDWLIMEGNICNGDCLIWRDKGAGYSSTL